jgi:hypothetical protein
MRKKSANKRMASRRQKMYNMRGCSSFFRHTKKRRNHKKYMKGGCAGMCPLTHSMIGGYLRKRSSIATTVKKNKPKITSDSSSHSRHSHSRTPSSQIGGGLTIIPQDVTNMFRSIGYTAGSVYNVAGGYELPTDPAPYAGHYRSSFGSKF